MASPTLRPSAALLIRLRSGGVVIDTRVLPNEAFDDLEVIEQVSEALATFGPVRQLRAWVLGDGAARWAADPALAWSGLYGLWALSQPAEEDDPEAAVVAVLAGAAARDDALGRLLRCFGTPCFALKRGGGLPIQDTFVEGRWQGALTSPPLGELADPPLLGRLAEARAALSPEDDAGAALLDNMAMDWIIQSTDERG